MFQVSITWPPVALNTRRTDVTSPSGVASWRSARTRPATRLSWRTPMSWPATLPSANRSASSQLLNPKSCPMVTMTWNVARRLPKSSWPLSTRHWATTTSIWRELCWSQTCAQPVCHSRELAQQPTKSLWPPSPLCAVPFQLPFPVSSNFLNFPWNFY